MCLPTRCLIGTVKLAERRWQSVAGIAIHMAGRAKRRVGHFYSPDAFEANPPAPARAPILRGLGAELVEIVVPDSSQIIWDWFDVCAVQNALLHGPIIDGTPDAFGPSLTALVARGRALGATDYQAVVNRRDAFRGDFEALLPISISCSRLP